jgi:hypothetical protein
MMSVFRGAAIGVLAALVVCHWLCPCQPAEAQRNQQAPWLAPHFGYIYPAGGQQGTTVEVTVGGQFLRDLSGMHVVGEGLQATVGKYSKPINAKEYFALEEKMKQLKGRFQAERAKAGPGGGRAAYQKALQELGLTEDDVQAVRSFVANATNPKRQLNVQIAETVVLQVRIAPDAPLGQREVRLVGPAGLSNPLSFRVGKLPEFRKNGSSGTTETEVRDTLPVVLNGQILPGGGSDRFAFTARRGARLVAVASARDLVPYLADAVPGWFQATLALYDPHGDEVAYADDFRFQPDPVLYYEVPADGRYVLEIKDALYRGRQDFVYRITLGELPFVTGVFPLGGRAGAPTTVELQGWNLPVQQLTLEANEAGPGIHWRAVLSRSLPWASDTLPECREEEPNDRPAEAQPLALPVIVNGRIDRPGDWDVFRFEGRAGQSIVAEVYARRLNSPLDSLLKLTDAAGQVLAANDDFEDKAAPLITHQADSRLSVTLKDSGTCYLYLGDTQHKGGPEYAYRLRVGEPRPDFALRVTPSSINARAGTAVPITVHALRRDGFNGAIALELKDAPPGMTLSGGRVPAGLDQVRLTLTVPPTPSERPLSLSLLGRANIQGRDVRRPGVPAEDMIQAFAYHHLVPTQRLLLMVTPRRRANYWWKLAEEKPVKIPLGGMARAAFSVPSGPLVDQAKLELSEPPEGVAIRSVTPSRDGVTIVLRADAAKAKPGLKGNLIVNAVMERDAEASGGKPQGGKQRIPLGSLPAIPFEIVK